MGTRQSFNTENMVIDFGLDRINGVFIQIFKNDEPMTNWSEFNPFDLRLTYDNIQDAIKKGLISKEDFTELCKIPIGDFKVYFKNFVTTEQVSEDFEYPKSLMNHYYSGRGFRIRTLGDYYKRLKLFRSPVSFEIVTWYEDGTSLEFQNDYDGRN